MSVSFQISAMSTMQLFQFPVTSQNVRVQGDIETPWFCLSDVCAVLTIANPTDVANRLDEDQRSRFNLGRQGDAWFVNESGLYDVVLRSDKPIAKQFRRWVTNDVLKQIRKTGSYSATPQDQQHFQPFGIKINIPEKMERLITAMDANLEDPTAVNAYSNALNSLQRILEHTKETETKQIAEAALDDAHKAFIIGYISRRNKAVTMKQLSMHRYFTSRKMKTAAIKPILDSMIGTKLDFLPGEGYRLK